MSHIGYLANQDQVIWSEDLLPRPHELPVLNWPVDLFKCDMTVSEIEDADVAAWHRRSISILDRQCPAI
jgi:hypothetical protein